MTRTPRTYFDDLYAGSGDPWGFEQRWYEQRKRALTVACLPRGRYRSGFEPGCSIGTLTVDLAGRCDQLLAADHVPSATAAARRRTGHLPHVRVEQRSVPEDWPPGPFDLLVLSELCYYFDRSELERLVDAALATLEPAATVIAVHWRGPTDYPLSGDDAHAVLAATPGLHPVAHHVEDEVLLDVWSAP